MNRITIILGTTLALFVALPASAQAKKKPVSRAVSVVVPLVLPPADSDQAASRHVRPTYASGEPILTTVAIR